MTDTFNPETASLRLSWPLPPPDNHCHASGQGGRFATKAYKAWLGEVNPRLRALLRDWEPDTERWWFVEVTLLLGGRGDAQNYLKPVLDALTGSYVDEVGRFDPHSGKTVGKGSIRKPGALWDDDRRVRGISLETQCVRHAEPTVVLRVFPTEPPCDWREAVAREAQQAREAAQDAARQAREAAAAARAAEKEEERQRDLALRTLALRRAAWGVLLADTFRGQEWAGVRATLKHALAGRTEPLADVPILFSAAQKAKLVAAGIWPQETK